MCKDHGPRLDTLESQMADQQQSVKELENRVEVLERENRELRREIEAIHQLLKSRQ